LTTPIIFKDNQKTIIFEVTIIKAFFGKDQSDFIEKNNLIFSKKTQKNSMLDRTLTTPTI